jgi:anti-anti-sigma factor
MGECSAGPPAVVAALDGGPAAALFTVCRAFTRVDSVEVTVPDEAVGAGDVRAVLHWPALFAAVPYGRPEVVVLPPAEVDVVTSADLGRDLLRLDAGTDVVVDLSGLVRCSASGVLVLVGAQRRFAQGGGSLRLRAPSPAFVRVLEGCGLADHFVLERPLDVPGRCWP